MLSLWLLLSLLFQQGQTASTPPARVSLSGVVILADTHQPIAGAQITVRPSGMSTQTDTSGKFRFFVSPGRYTLTFDRAGFMPQADPAHGITETGMTITVNPDQNNDSIVLTVIPAPVISGHTYFPNGEPLAAAAVQALRWRLTPLGPRLKTVQTTLTDDNGEYRLFGMAPGEYLVSASYSHSAQRGAMGKIRLSPNVPDPDDGYATIFYRSETAPSAAQKVRLAPGMDTEGINIILSDVRRFKIRGRAVAQEPVFNLKVVFVPEGSDVTMEGSGLFPISSANDSFEIRN